MDRTVSSGPKYFPVLKVVVIVRRIAKAVVRYKSHDSSTSVESRELKVWLEPWGSPLYSAPRKGEAQRLAQIQRVEIYQSICAPTFMWRGI